MNGRKKERKKGEAPEVCVVTASWHSSAMPLATKARLILQLTILARGTSLVRIAVHSEQWNGSKFKRRVGWGVGYNYSNLKCGVGWGAGIMLVT